MKKVLIKLKNITSKEDLFNNISAKLNLPEYCGKNLDALHDVLTDIHEETELIIRESSALGEVLGEKYAASFERVLLDSAEENENLSVKFLDGANGRLHHVCICTNEYDKYVALFEELFGLTVNRTLGDAPARKLWFNEGVQINELTVDEENGTSVDHISLGVDDVPAVVLDALENGCTQLPNGAHWIALPNGVKIELMQNA